MSSTDQTCSRRACSIKIRHDAAWIHTQTRMPYCATCARRINHAAGDDLVERPYLIIRAARGASIARNLAAAYRPEGVP